MPRRATGPRPLRLHRGSAHIAADRPDCSARQRDEDDRCAHPVTGFEHWLSRYVWIPDTQDHAEPGAARAKSADGESAGILKFDLWPAQARVIPDLLSCLLLIFLKARQLGITWVVIAYCVWRMQYFPNKTVLFLSQGQEEANEMIVRARFIYDHQPDWMKAAHPLARKPSVSEVHYTTGSRIKALPATENAGSSFTASIVVMDEAAKMRFAKQTYTAVKPTVDAGGQLIIISTAKGASGLFYTLWKRAEAGLNKYKAIFLDWKSRPSRTQEWYDAKMAEAADPDEHIQEYPANSTEAFRTSGNVRFAGRWIAAQRGNIRDPIPDGSLPTDLQGIGLPGELRVYATQRANYWEARRVGIGCDLAEGKLDDKGNAKGDYNHAVFVDLDTLEELACIHDHSEPDEFAEKVYRAWLHYSGLGHLERHHRPKWTDPERFAAWIVPERNKDGQTFIYSLKNILDREGWRCYPIVQAADGYSGMPTTVKSKPIIIARLATCLRTEAIKVRSLATLNEMGDFRRLGEGRSGAPSGSHDDRVMAWAVLLGWRFRFEDAAGTLEIADNPIGEVQWSRQK